MVSSDTIGMNRLQITKRQIGYQERRPGQVENLGQNYGNGQDQGSVYYQEQSSGGFDQGVGSYQGQGYNGNQGQGYGNNPGQGYGNNPGQGYGNNQGQGISNNGNNGQDSDNGFSSGLQLGGGSDGNNQGKFGNSEGRYGSSQGGYGSNPGGYGSNQVGFGGNSWTTQRPPFNMISNENSISKETTLCIRNCPTTNQYDPICGDDNITYQNAGKIKCAQEQCNKRKWFLRIYLLQ